MTPCYRREGIRFNRKFLVVKQACRKDTVKRVMRETGCDVVVAIERVLEIRLKAKS
jgi:hypothetical protein